MATLLLHGPVWRPNTYNGPAASLALADSADVFRQFKGYTIIDVVTIVGWRDQDGTGEDGPFKGCKFSRIIIFEGNKALKCSSYAYHYAYRPDAVILSKTAGVYKMIVEGEAFDMQSF